MIKIKGAHKANRSRARVKVDFETPVRKVSTRLQFSASCSYGNIYLAVIYVFIFRGFRFYCFSWQVRFLYFSHVN